MRRAFAASTSNDPLVYLWPKTEVKPEQHRLLRGNVAVRKQLMDEKQVDDWIQLLSWPTGCFSLFPFLPLLSGSEERRVCL